MIKVLKKGLHTSIQDLGRFGYRKYGVPVSGAMDAEAAKLSNLILGNNENAAVMEITLQGPKLHFLSPTQIAITGAKLSPTKNGESIELNTIIPFRKGDILDFGIRKYGVRSYLAVAGGFQTELVYGSRSFYEGITKKEKIDSNDELLFCTNQIFKNSSQIGFSNQKDRYERIELSVTQGPEFDMLNEVQKQFLLSKIFTLGLNNRMAYQLREKLSNQLNSILSSVVLPGTIQLTPSGKMIILMRDCQTTGGYPRILQLKEQSINLLAQKMKGEPVCFKF